MGVVSTLQAAVCVLDMSRMHCSAVAGEVDGIKRCPCRRVAHDHPVNREHPHTNTHALPSSALSPFRMLYSTTLFALAALPYTFASPVPDAATATTSAASSGSTGGTTNYFPDIPTGTTYQDQPGEGRRIHRESPAPPVHLGEFTC
jgi:hypothetical protein